MVFCFRSPLGPLLFFIAMFFVCLFFVVVFLFVCLFVFCFCFFAGGGGWWCGGGAGCVYFAVMFRGLGRDPYVDGHVLWGCIRVGVSCLFYLSLPPSPPPHTPWCSCWPSQGGSSVAVLLCLCIGGFLCDVCL